MEMNGGAMKRLAIKTLYLAYSKAAHSALMFDLEEVYVINSAIRIETYLHNKLLNKLTLKSVKKMLQKYFFYTALYVTCVI